MSEDAHPFEASCTERSTAILLMHHLVPYRSFLVEFGGDHWLVVARYPDEPTRRELSGSIESWARTHECVVTGDEPRLTGAIVGWRWSRIADLLSVYAPVLAAAAKLPP